MTVIVDADLLVVRVVCGVDVVVCYGDTSGMHLFTVSTSGCSSRLTRARHDWKASPR